MRGPGQRRRQKRTCDRLAAVAGLFTAAIYERLGAALEECKGCSVAGLSLAEDDALVAMDDLRTRRLETDDFRSGWRVQIPRLDCLQTGLLFGFKRAKGERAVRADAMGCFPHDAGQRG